MSDDAIATETKALTLAPESARMLWDASYEITQLCVTLRHLVQHEDFQECYGPAFKGITVRIQDLADVLSGAMSDAESFDTKAGAGVVYGLGAA